MTKKMFGFSELQIYIPDTDAYPTRMIRNSETEARSKHINRAYHTYQKGDLLLYPYRFRIFYPIVFKTLLATKWDYGMGYGVLRLANGFLKNQRTRQN